MLWLQKRAVLTALGLVQAAVPMAELCTELCGCCEEQRGSKGGQQSWRLRVAQDGFSSSLPWAESKAEIYVSRDASVKTLSGGSAPPTALLSRQLHNLHGCFCVRTPQRADAHRGAAHRTELQLHHGCDTTKQTSPIHTVTPFSLGS